MAALSIPYMESACQSVNRMKDQMKYRGLAVDVHIYTSSTGVVMATARGPVTGPAVIAALDIAWARAQEKSAFKALLLDLRQAWVLNELAAPQPFSLARIAESLPCALVLSANQLQRGRAYAMESAARGMVVGAFSEPSNALRWVLERSAAMLAQRGQCQRKGSATPVRRPSGVPPDPRWRQGNAPDLAP